MGHLSNPVIGPLLWVVQFMLLQMHEATTPGAAAWSLGERTAKGVNPRCAEPFLLVQPGRDFGATTEILGGVSADDQVILNPADSLVNGMTVRISVPSATAAGS
jgi:hypothetical protein